MLRELAKFGLGASFGIAALVGPMVFDGQDYRWVWLTLGGTSVVLLVLGLLSHWDRGWQWVFRFSLIARAEADRLRLIAQTADDDDRNISNLLKCGRSGVRSGLNHIEPFVVFEVPVTNCSIFDLTLDRVDGTATLGGSPLPYPPSIHKQFSGPVRHGNDATVLVRVFVPSSAVPQVQSGGAVVGLGRCAVYFKYEHRGTRKEARMGLPDGGYKRIGEGWSA